MRRLFPPIFLETIHTGALYQKRITRCNKTILLPSEQLPFYGLQGFF